MTVLDRAAAYFESVAASGGPERIDPPQRDEAERLIADLVAEVKRIQAIVDSPDPHNFMLGSVYEMKHQRIRWEREGDDQSKTDVDWFWLVVYLAAGAVRTMTADMDATLSVTADDAIEQAFRNKDTGDWAKLLHRITTISAAAGNWHAAKLGLTTMRPH